jgi:hypothetical protein
MFQKSKQFVYIVFYFYPAGYPTILAIHICPASLLAICVAFLNMDKENFS